MVLAPDSRGTTWDAITGDFGPDVRFLERALGETLGHRAVDRTRVAVAGSQRRRELRARARPGQRRPVYPSHCSRPAFSSPCAAWADHAASSRTGSRTGSCRSTDAAAAWSPSSSAATLCGTGSSRAATRSRRGWQGRRSTGSSEPRSEPAARALDAACQIRAPSSLHPLPRPGSLPPRMHHPIRNGRALHLVE